MVYTCCTTLGVFCSLCIMVYCTICFSFSRVGRTTGFNLRPLSRANIFSSYEGLLQCIFVFAPSASEQFLSKLRVSEPFGLHFVTNTLSVQ